jgi:hypothetical protein
VLEWTRLPEVAVIVRVWVPAGVELLVVTLSVELPLPPVTVLGLKFAFAPAGKPLTLSATSPPNPFAGVTFTV